MFLSIYLVLLPSKSKLFWTKFQLNIRNINYKVPCNYWYMHCSTTLPSYQVKWMQFGCHTHAGPDSLILGVLPVPASRHHANHMLYGLLPRLWVQWTGLAAVRAVPLPAKFPAKNKCRGIIAHKRMVCLENKQTQFSTSVWQEGRDGAPHVWCRRIGLHVLKGPQGPPSPPGLDLDVSVCLSLLRPQTKGLIGSKEFHRRNVEFWFP
jgi:hypothetical protein